MKRVLPLIAAVLLVSCTQGKSTQEIELTSSIKASATAAVTTATPPATPTATLTPSPTDTPSVTPPACTALLSPADGAELPAVGRITFAWEAVSQATFYALNIRLPSGNTVSFETRELFRNQYIEAFSAEGTYQWSVTAQDRKRREICSSEIATFSKPFSNVPNQPEDDRKRK